MTPSGFYLYTFKRKSETLAVEVICEDCYPQSPEKCADLTPSEILKGYTQTLTPYFGDHECVDCGKVPVYPSCATCGKPQGQPHPYDPILCRRCGDAKAMADGQAAYEQHAKGVA